MNTIKGPASPFEEDLFSSGIVGASGDEIRLLRNMFLAVRRNLMKILIFGFLCALGVYGASSQMEDQFTSSARVKLNTRVTTDVQYTPDGSDLPITLASLESELEVLRSSDLIEASIRELELIPAPDETDQDALAAFDVELEEMVRSIRDRREINQIGSSSAVFEIVVTDPNPNLAPRLANSLARQYLERQRLEKVATLERAQSWLSERTLQLQGEITNLLNSQEALIIESPYSVEESATIKAQRQIAERQLISRTLEAETQASLIDNIETELQTGSLEAAAQLLPEQSERLQASLSLLASDDTSTQNDQREDLRSAVEDEISLALVELHDQLAFQKDQVLTAEASVEDLRGRQELQAVHDSQVRRVENEIVVTQAIYQDFVSQLSRRTEQSNFLNSDGQVIEFARPATDPSKPNETLNAVLAFIASVFVGVLTAMVSGLFNKRLRTTWEYEDVCGVPLQGTIPLLDRDINFIETVLDGGTGTFQYPALGAFSRKLRLSLAALEKREIELPTETTPNFASSRQPDTPPLPPAPKRARILAGASSVIGEGQSTALFSIARAFAEAGENVLLIDGDFAGSPYAQHFTRAPMPDGNAQWGSRRSLRTSRFPGLKIMPAIGGPEIAQRFEETGFFGSHTCDEIIDSLASEFDRIIIDCPAILSSLGSLALMDKADDVILFVRWNTTKKPLVENSVRLLRDVSIRPAFCVTTFVNHAKLSGYGDTSLSHVNFAN